MTRKTVLSIAFLSLGAAWAGWEIAASLNPRDDLEPLTNLVADHIPPAITFAAIALLLSWLPGHFVEAYTRRGKTMPVTIPATPEPGAPAEPLLSRATIIAIGSAAIAVAVAFGVPVTDDQRFALLGLLAAAAPIVAAVWARKKVFSPNTVRQMVLAAAEPTPAKRDTIT